MMALRSIVALSRAVTLQTVRVPACLLINRRTGCHDAAEKNRQARRELAAAYRIFDKMQMNEGVCNHLTLMAPAASGSGDDVMLLIPYGLHWSQVTASSLLGLDADNKVVEGKGEPENTAVCIHHGIHSEMGDKAKCVMHLHAPYSTALACLEDPTLKMCHQNSAKFYNRVAYETRYEGFADTLQEGRHLAGVMGDNIVMMMGNHGILSVAPTVSLAFDYLYYFERACMFQVLAMSTGRPLSTIPDTVCKKLQAQDDWPCYANAHFNAWILKLYKESPHVVF